MADRGKKQKTYVKEENEEGEEDSKEQSYEGEDEDDDNDNDDKYTLNRRNGIDRKREKEQGNDEEENDGEMESPASSSSSSHEINKELNVSRSYVDGISDRSLHVQEDSEDMKRHQVSIREEEKKKPDTNEETRRSFQRLWTDEDEIGLLQGYLEHTLQRGPINSSNLHDIAAFYEQIKNRLQLDFNKSQLVDKLRRLRKKYQNAMNRIASGKELTFKTLHDHASFEISRKIWTVTAADDDENDHINNNNLGTPVSAEKSIPHSQHEGRKRCRETESTPVSFPSAIEDKLMSCMSPLFNELMGSVKNRQSSFVQREPFFSPLQPDWGISSINFCHSKELNEKWRKQQILELEVYSKRVELIQEQIRMALQELNTPASACSEGDYRDIFALPDEGKPSYNSFR